MNKPFATYRRAVIQPQDFVDAIRSMGDGAFSGWSTAYANTIPAAEYLNWAEESGDVSTAKGADVATTYAKRAVCRRIDALLCDHHMWKIMRESYPDKLTCLSEIGFPAHRIVHTLVINIRNGVEHGYRQATAQEAKDSVQVADLFLKASDSWCGLTRGTRHEMSSMPTVLNPCFTEFGYSSKNGSVEILLGSVKPLPMALLDGSAPQPEGFVVDPVGQEIRQVLFDKFTRAEAIQLAKEIRRRGISSVNVTEPSALRQSLGIE